MKSFSRPWKASTLLTSICQSKTSTSEVHSRKGTVHKNLLRDPLSLPGVTGSGMHLYSYYQHSKFSKYVRIRCVAAFL